MTDTFNTDPSDIRSGISPSGDTEDQRRAGGLVVNRNAGSSKNADHRESSLLLPAKDRPIPVTGVPQDF